MFASSDRSWQKIIRLGFVAEFRLCNRVGNLEDDK